MAAQNPYTYITTFALCTGATGATGFTGVSAPVVPPGTVNPELIGCAANATYLFWSWRYHNGSLHV